MCISKCKRNYGYETYLLFYLTSTGHCMMEISQCNNANTNIVVLKIDFLYAQYMLIYFFWVQTWAGNIIHRFWIVYQISIHLDYAVLSLGNKLKMTPICQSCINETETGKISAPVLIYYHKDTIVLAFIVYTFLSHFNCNYIFCHFYYCFFT